MIASNCRVARSTTDSSPNAPARAGTAGGLIETLEAISRQGTLHRPQTQGIVLKAPDTSEMNEAVARLADRGDLRLDMRRACQVIMSARNGLPDVAVTASPIQVVTPFNLP